MDVDEVKVHEGDTRGVATIGGGEGDRTSAGEAGEAGDESTSDKGGGELKGTLLRACCKAAAEGTVPTEVSMSPKKGEAGSPAHMLRGLEEPDEDAVAMFGHHRGEIENRNTGRALSNRESQEG